MKKSGNVRLFFLAVGVLAAGGIIALRLFFIQVKQHEFYAVLAQNQHELSQELLPKRGEIYMQDLSRRNAADSVSRIPAAINKKGFFAYAVPKDVSQEKKDEAALQVATVLGMDAGLVGQRLSKRADPYEPLKRKLDDAEADGLGKLGIAGIRLGKETWRYYPAGNMAAVVTGYVSSTGDTEKGLYGVESFYNAKLSGTKGYRAAEKDALGALIPFRVRDEQAPKDGNDIVLTIDANIQFTARKILGQTLKQWDSTGGLILVLEPSTGKILALAAEPSYDPNTYGDVKDMSYFLNGAVEKIFEPGSVFKPITMAAALEEKLVTPNTTYTDEGIVRIGGYAIRNFDEKAYGVRTMSEVIELSLNTGAVYAQRLLGKERFTAYVKEFGFGEKSGVDLPGELKGSINNLKQKAEVNFATASFGQGISTTPLQMANAIAVIANGGKLMRPYVVEKIIHPDGTEEKIEPTVIREVLSPAAAKAMARIMVDAVRGKFEKKADVKGYSIAGKTGTAQIPDSRTGGYMPVEEGVIHTFVGFAPAFDPRFLVFIKMDKPVGVRFAANSLTPAFHDLATYLLNYFSIPPDDPTHEVK